MRRPRQPFVRPAAESDSIQPPQNRDFGETLIAPTPMAIKCNEGRGRQTLEQSDRPTRRCDPLCRGTLAPIDRERDWPPPFAPSSIRRGMKSRPPTHSLTRSLGRPFGDDFPYALKSRSLCPLVESPGYKQVLFIMIVDVVPELTTIRAIGRVRTERRRGRLSRSSPPSIRGRSRPSPDNS